MHLYYSSRELRMVNSALRVPLAHRINSIPLKDMGKCGGHGILQGSWSTSDGGKDCNRIMGIRARIRPALDTTQGFAQHFRFFVLLVVPVTNGAASLKNKRTILISKNQSESLYKTCTKNCARLRARLWRDHSKVYLEEQFVDLG